MISEGSVTASHPPARRRVVLLGATGSVGTSACDIIGRYPDSFELVGAVAGRDAAGLTAVVERFGVQHSALVQPPQGATLPSGCGVGMNAACAVAALDADVVLVAITGAAALRPAMAAIDRGTDVALATKEVLVMAGELVRVRAADTGSRLLPVDSEHSALWQCLRGEDPASVSRLILTASGGPFRERDPASFAAITVDEALHHPTWDMGPKVTIDSSTMMNKGLEVIEAHFLFDVPYERIDVAVHPGSIVHSCVEFCDGATLAQLGIPDMRLPIALALADGRRLPGVCAPLQLVEIAALEFHPVDPQRYPAVALAIAAGERGGAAPCVLNAANEAAVAAFLGGRCGYHQIVSLVAKTLDAAELPADPTWEDLIELDGWARAAVDRAVAVAVTA